MNISETKGEVVLYREAMSFETRGPKRLDTVVLKVAGTLMDWADTVRHPRTYAFIKNDAQLRKVILYREIKQ